MQLEVNTVQPGHALNLVVAREESKMNTHVTGELARWMEDDMGAPLNLAPVCPGGLPNSAYEWGCARTSIREAWGAIMGQPEYTWYDRQDVLLESFEAPTYTGKVYRQQTGPDASQLSVVLEPREARYAYRPGAVVPFYHSDEMMGYNLQNKTVIVDTPHMQFGRCLVEQGYVVVCCEAFPFNILPGPHVNRGSALWKAASAKLLQDHPHWTGIGKLAADVMRAVDLLLSQPCMDLGRIAAVGHSLGGKMAFTAGALDERIKAVIGSDFGLGWDFSNWDAPWYYGPQVRNTWFRWGNHHLLAAMAPRPFLLLGGEADRPESRQYLAAARPVFTLYGESESLGFLYHGAGHQPPPDAMQKAYQWLAEQFALPLAPPIVMQSMDSPVGGTI